MQILMQVKWPQNARTFEERFEEHVKAPSPVNDHHNITVYPTSVDKLSVLGGGPELH